MIKSKHIKKIIKDLYFRTWDYLPPKKGPISKKGYLVYDSISCDEFENDRLKLLDFLANNRIIKDLFAKQPNGYVIHFTDVLAYYPGLRYAIDERIVCDIRAYLGPFSKLDGVYLGYFNSSSDLTVTHNTSSQYHHDSVGHRLKFFVPLNSFGNIPFPTSYLEGTNHYKWKSYDNIPGSGGKRMSDNVINTAKEAQITVSYGMNYIFDTNGLHRGAYNKADKNRLIMQFEFSNQLFNPFGQIGPMNYSLNEDAYNYYDSMRILTRRRFKKENSIFYQKGLRHRSFDKSCAKIEEYI